MLHYLCHTLSQCCFRQPLSDGLAPILSYKPTNLNPNLLGRRKRAFTKTSLNSTTSLSLKP